MAESAFERLKAEVDELKALLETLEGQGEFDACDVVYQRAAHAMPVGAAASVARRVMIHLYRGSIETARQALEDGWCDHHGRSRQLSGQELLEEPLCRVISNGDLRLINALEGAGILTVKDLLMTTANQWLSIPSVGPSSSDKLRTLQLVLKQRVEG